ncbi:MAG: GTP cyclohydrolase I FolE [Candidatus Sericytochromatia bacterium]
MSLNLQKVDPELGQRIHEHLRKQGVETPSRFQVRDTESGIDGISAHFRAIMEILGLDLSDDSLRGTPERLGRMYMEELFWGLNPSHFPKITTVTNKMGYDEMVVEKNIVVHSCCEHHFAMIDGYAHVAYIPDDKVLGLSKINRVVEYFARRPQIQERLTEQIYHALAFLLETPDIAVMISARHYCVKSRGVEDINSETLTSKLGGCFKEDPASRQEFLALARTRSICSP